MPADVNVTEKAREAALARWALGSSDTTQMLMAVDAALAVVADPEVLAGIAGVLRDAEDEWVRRYADAEGAPPTRSEFQAAAVVELLTGGRP